MPTTLEDDNESSSAGLVDLGNGVLSAALGEPIPSSAPEGLYVVGNFDPARPSIVYVHAWVPDGNAPRALNLEGWQGAGFNTLLVRWHVAATDSAAGCPGGGGFFGVPNMPCNAEARVFGQRGSNPAANYAGERMVHAYRSFFGAYASPGPVRMVAHSLGAQMATYITYRLVREGWGDVSRIGWTCSIHLRAPQIPARRTRAISFPPTRPWAVARVAMAIEAPATVVWRARSNG